MVFLDVSYQNYPNKKYKYYNPQNKPPKNILTLDSQI